jgi:hypothetical protein
MAMVVTQAMATAVFRGVVLATVPMAAAIQAPMVLRMVMLPRQLHPPQHQQLASNPARNPDKPAQRCVGSFLI